MMRLLLACLSLLLLSSCGAVSHITDTLTCIGVCQHTRVQHEANQPKEKEQ